MSKSFKKTNIPSDLKHFIHDHLALIMNNWWYRGAKQTIS